MSQTETEHPPGEPEHPIFRTSPERGVKMMVIMLGIIIVGGIIFFSMWDYWISIPPAVTQMGAAETTAPAVVTGKDINVSLTFVESSDFRTLAFNALPGEADHNPEIRANVGDKIIFDVTNGGKSFHAFGVTQEEEGLGFIISGSQIASANNPLKPEKGGISEFIPSEEGVYYYICTVQGHREQGMEGKIIVGEVSGEPAETQMIEPEVAPSSAVPAPGFEDVTEMIVKGPMAESAPEAMRPFTGTVSIPSGSSVPGCDETNECYIPADVTINAGETVTWSNDDTAAHTVTSGNPTDGHDGTFDSSLFMAGTTFSYTFDEENEYNYFCMVHPWMSGKVKVI